jgi:hypothetical protein
VTSEFIDGTRHVIYPWNQSKIENPQAPAFIRGVNLKSQISNLKSIDPPTSSGQALVRGSEVRCRFEPQPMSIPKSDLN